MVLIPGGWMQPNLKTMLCTVKKHIWDQEIFIVLLILYLSAGRFMKGSAKLHLKKEFAY